MDLIVLDDIPLQVEPGDLLQRLQLPETSPQAGEALSLLGQARGVGRPRACFRLVEKGQKGEDFIVLGGVRFSSRLLRENLGQGEGPVAAFVATCGVELERWAESYEDLLLRFCAEEVCELALRCSFEAVSRRIDTALGADTPAKSNMNPGSLQDWPLSQQRQLFELVGDVRGAIGVELTGSFLMRPRKSLSGVRYSSAGRFVNCELCPREKCRGRRAAFDEHLYESTFTGAGMQGWETAACGECGEEAGR
ncbi:MAG: hypothetical protein JXQ83_11860 [Candidatus Glassbacteria bacterium]|nr:hypothetical protein [Candidatus Glassbacteria bacterium]